MLNLVLIPDVVWSAIDHAHSLDRRAGRYGVPIGLIEMQKRKARGVKAGIFDYIFFYQRRAFHIELKRDADGDLSADQITWAKGLIAQGFEIKICWTKDQVFNTVAGWGLTRPGTKLQ